MVAFRTWTKDNKKKHSLEKVTADVSLSFCSLNSAEVKVSFWAAVSEFSIQIGRVKTFQPDPGN